MVQPSQQEMTWGHPSGRKGWLTLVRLTFSLLACVFTNRPEDRLQAPGLSDGYDVGKGVASSDSVKAAAHQVAEAIKANIDVEAIEGSVKGFAQSSKVLMGMLDEVQTIHPFIGGLWTRYRLPTSSSLIVSLIDLVPVLAFKAVVTLELKRRENDSKIIVLHLKMQEMMSVLLQ